RLVAADASRPTAAARAGTRRSAQIQALNGLCFIHGQRNDYDHAHEVIRQAIELVAESPRLVDRAEVCFQAGLISFRQDDYAEAREALPESLAICTRLERTAAAEVNQVAIAAALRDLGRHDEAGTFLRAPLVTEYRTIKMLALLVSADVYRVQLKLDSSWRQL